MDPSECHEVIVSVNWTLATLLLWEKGGGGGEGGVEEEQEGSN